MRAPNPDKRTHCGACGCQLGDKHNPTSRDFGGDCMACSALVGDAGAARALAKLQARADAQLAKAERAKARAAAALVAARLRRVKKSAKQKALRAAKKLEEMQQNNTAV